MSSDAIISKALVCTSAFVRLLIVLTCYCSKHLPWIEIYTLKL